jgi:hypothetical protein
VRWLSGFSLNRFFVQSLGYARAERSFMLILGFDEDDVVRFYDFVHGLMITSIGFGILSIPDKDTFFRSLKNFGVMFVLDKNKGSTAYFLQVRDIRLVSKVGLIRGDVV